MKLCALAIVIGAMASASSNTTLSECHRSVQSAIAVDRESEIRQVEEEWRLASIRSDTAAFDRLMAPDHHAIRTDGVVTTRESRLKAFGSGEVRTQSLEYSDLRIRVEGAIAVVTGLATRKVAGGQPRDFQYRYTRIWHRDADRWRCIEFQSTTVNPGHLGGLPSSPSEQRAVNATHAVQTQTLTTDEAKSHIGQDATVCGTVKSTRYADTSNGKPMFLNLDKFYPSATFTVVIFGTDREKFGQPEIKYRDKEICVTGRITEFRGGPEIVVKEPKQISEVKK